MLETFKNLLSHMNSGDRGFQKLQNIENLEQVKTELESLQTSSPKLFMNNAPEIVRILESFEEEVQNVQAFFFLEVLTNNVETCSDIYQKEGIELIIRMCVYLCKRIGLVLDEGSSTFLNLDFEEKYPDLEKFQLENPSSALVVRFVELFGRLVSSVDFGKFMQTIKSEIYGLGEVGDWRLKSAVLILFGEFHEIGDFKEIMDVFAYLISNAVNPDLRVRYYAAYSIGVAYSNFKNKFEKKYLTQLIPIVVSGLESDADIVSCQWIWLFIVMAESSQKEPVFREYIDQIIHKVCLLINLNNKYITEKCLESLQSLTLIPRSLSKTRIEKYLEICHTILTSSSLQNNNYIIERCCICMTSVLSESNPMTAINYIEVVAENICKFSNDMAINSFYLCWQDLCACGVATVNWSFMFEKVLSSLENSQLKNIDINNAFKSIVDTVDFYRLEFVPFSHRTLQLLLKNFKNDLENDSPICDFDMLSLALQKLVELAKPTDNLQKWENDIGEILRFVILKTIEFEFDELYDLKLSFLELLKVLLKEYGRLLRESEVDHLIENLWKLSNFLTNERNSHINLASKEELNYDSNSQSVEAPIYLNNEDENEEINWDDLESSSVYGPEKFFVSINECITKIPDIFQVLFEHVNDKSELIHNEWEEVERKLTENVALWDLMYVGHFICSFVEYYSYEFLKEKWNYFNGFIEKFILHENSEMRQIIVFTLGLFAQKTPEDLVSLELVSHWIELTKQCFLIEKCEEFYENSYDSCQDNCISTLGKIIFKFGEKYSLVQVYSSWLAKLPLKFDEAENTIQITNIHAMLTTPSVFNQTLNLESMFLLLKVFASLKSWLDEKQKTVEVLKLYNISKLSVELILKKEMFIENQVSLLRELNEVEKEDLNVLMTEY